MMQFIFNQVVLEKKSKQKAKPNNIVAVLNTATIISTFLAVFAVQTSHAKPTIAINKNGIQVWKVSVPNSKLLGFKAQAVINADSKRVLAAVMDVPASKEWVPNTKKALSITKDKVYGVPKMYMLVNMPFPITDREMIVTGQVIGDNKGNYKVINKLSKSSYMPPNKKYVAISEYKGTWVFQNIGKNKTRVFMTGHANPGGSLPSWVVNMFVTEQPYDMLKNLRKLVKKPAYANAQLNYVNAAK